jgi:entry exclusion lipoprotein TrbK
MKLKQIFPLALAALIAVLVVGCGKSEDVTSPSCADLDKVKDPAQREELLKKCPRGAPGGFKPSEKREW